MLDKKVIIEKIKDLNGWNLDLEKNSLKKEFNFKSYLKNDKIPIFTFVDWGFLLFLPFQNGSKIK